MSRQLGREAGSDALIKNYLLEQELGFLFAEMVTGISLILMESKS
jgi:hypothetical protein